MKKILTLLFILIFVGFIIPYIGLGNQIKIIGKTWSSGFFEVSSGVTGDENYIFVSDTNNAQIQVFDINLKPVFHFGGYGAQEGQFISIQGIQSSDNEVYICSIDDYQKKKGRIQVFSAMGVYKKTFSTPSIRSDFLEISPSLDGTLFAITETTLCVYQKNGTLIKEISELKGIPFLDLCGVDVLKDGIVLIDSQRRGFLFANQDLSESRREGEEFVSIPVAIEVSKEEIFIADAKGSISIFSPSGKYLSAIQINSQALINDLYFTGSSTLIASTSIPHTILKISTSTGDIYPLEVQPSNSLELHWPSRFCVNQDGLLATNDDYTKGIKKINAKTNTFLVHVGTLHSDSQIGFIDPSDITFGEKEMVYAIDQNNTRRIYCVGGENCTVHYEGSVNSRFIQIATFEKMTIVLDAFEKKILFINIQGKLEKTITLPTNSPSIVGFNFLNEDLYILDATGIIYIVNPETTKLIRKFALQKFHTLSSPVFFIPFEDRILVSNRDECRIDTFNTKNGNFFSTYGVVGGPRTYVQDSNAQIDLWYETGSFLFPEKILLAAGNIYVADAGNQRIQCIPVEYCLETVIQLQIDNKNGYVNGNMIAFDSPPFIQKNRTMVPLRFISESFEAKVQWNSTSQEITIHDRNTTIKMKIGSDKMTINDSVVPLDSPPMIKTGRTFVPLRAISESLNAKVEWNASEQIILIRRI